MNDIAPPIGDTASETPETAPRRLAVLFTDVVGSSRYFKQYGNRAGRAMLSRHVELSRQPIDANGGTFVKTIGDSVLAYFLSPLDALRAAAAIQKQLQANNQEKQRDRDQIHVRIGIHYANAIVEDQDIFGDAVNLAAKLVPFCRPDRILISQATAEQVRSRIDIPTEQVEVTDPKNVLGGMRVFNVVWDQSARAAPMAGFVVLANPSWSLANAGFKQAWHRMLLQNRSLWGAMADQIRLPEDRSRVAMLFRSADKALVSARQVRSFLEKTLAGSGERVFIPVPIVIHYGSLPGDTASEWEQSGVPWASLGVGDIHIARDAADHWPASSRPETTPSMGGAARPAFYRLGTGKGASDAALFHYQDAFIQGEYSPCFYCGDRRHPAVACPSKAMDGPPKALDAIGRLSLADLNALFRDALDKVRRQAGGNILSLGDKDRLAFEAVYELHWYCQLGFFRVIWANMGDPWDQLRQAGPRGKRGGRLWLAQDCLRTGNCDQAEALLSALEDEPGGDFALHVLRGFLYVDLCRPARAATAFMDALATAPIGAGEIFAHLLLHRLYRLQGDLVRSDRHLTKARQIYKYCPEALYEETKLALDRGQTEMALDRLETLIADVPTYFPAALVDPEMGPHARSVVPRLRSIWERGRADAGSAMADAQAQIDRLRQLISDSDWIAKEEAVMMNISEFLSTDSFLGCLEALRLAQRMTARIDSAIQSRKQMVSERLFELGKICRHQEVLMSDLPRSPTAERIRHRLVQLLEEVHDGKARVAAEAPNLFMELDPFLRQAESDLGDFGKRIKRLYEREEIRRFMKCFFHKSLFYQGVNLFVAAVCLPLLSYYFNLLMPGLSVSSQTLGAYQKTILIIGAFAAMMMAVFQTLKKTYPRWKAQQRSRMDRLKAIP